MGRLTSKIRFAGGAALVALAVMLMAPLTSVAQGTMTLNGAGSTFAFPIFSKAFAEYTKLHPEVQVNYQSIGSGGGIKQFSEKTVDFGATDGPLTDEQLADVGGPDAVVHIPVTMGAVAVTYNLPSLSAPLQLDGPTLANIFLGKITKWNDEAITALNPGVDLPDTDIAVVHRADGSGTTNIFVTYLASVSDEWKTQVGTGNSVNWPVGIGGQGNEGVAGQITQLEGAIGYNELAYALQNNIAYAAIKNSAGAFVQASPEGATACAAAAASTLPEDLRVMISGCTGADPAIYPISGFTWILIYTDQSDAAKGQALVDLVYWLIHDGQQYGKDLEYAPLPPAVADKGTEKLLRVTSGGQQLLQVPATPEAGGTPAA
jgi:phosphate transport system substrate-binding protein